MTARDHYLYRTMPEALLETLLILSKYAEVIIEWPHPDPIRHGLYIDVDWPTVRAWISVNTSDISHTDLELLEALGVDTSSKVIHLDVAKKL